MSPFHRLSARSLQGETIDFRRYAGQVVLVVNTASRCGFTPQYAGLEALFQKYHHEGLEILGFPCNQFGRQEPGTSEDIGETCFVNYGVTFTMFEKTDVNGPDAHPVFSHLRSVLPGWWGSPVRWNFTKFLIGRDGEPLKRFAPVTAPARMESTIARALGKR